MTKPVTIPNTFATATTAIPLSNLDADFSTVATAMNDANTYSNYAPDTGSANAYVVTLTGVSTTYSAGLRIQFKAGNANTTASTLNVNAQGAKNITYQDASALASGTIAANSIVDVMYDGTQFLLMNDPAGATGGDVTGPASATDNAVVRFDGTTGKLVQNSVVTIADSTGDISGVGQLNATTVDTTNLEVTNIKAKDGTAAASIADSTGVISITANPVLSGGTANGVLYLNGSKVATSGSALTFDGTNLGVGVTPSYKLDVAWNSGATERARLRNSSSSTAAITLLEIGNDANNSLQIMQRSSTASNANESVLQNNSGGALTFTTIADTPIRFLQNNIEQMRLTSTGLGIGTSSPSQKLTLVNNATSTFLNTTDNTVNTLYGTSTGLSAGLLGTLTNHPLVFYANNGEKMRLDSSGNLGIGTSSPAYKLDVRGSNARVYVSSGDTSYAIFNAANNSGQFVLAVDNSTGSGYSMGNYSRVLYSDGAYPICFATNNTERARITSGGDLLVGKTSYGGTATGIDLGNNGFVGSYSSATTSSSNSFAMYSNGASAYRFYVDWAGTVFATSTTISAISDIRFKENIQDLDVGLSAIMALKPRKFDWKAGKGKDIKGDRGFIAQEIEQVFPDLIDEWKDPAPEGEEPYKSVRQDLIPVLVKAIQEQQALIESLTSRVAQLEGTQP